MLVEAFDLFSGRNFIPHGHCYLWKPGLVFLHLASDLIIALSCFSIPLLLVYFIRQRPSFPFQGIFWLFCALIIACGITHLIAVWTLWHPTYWLSGLFKAITAGISLYTAGKMVQLIPHALALPTPALLEATNQALAQKIQQIRQTEMEPREYAQRLSLLVKHTPLAVIEWTPDFEVADWNPSAEKIFGYSRIEALGRHAVELMVPETVREQVNQVWKHLLLQQGGTRSTNENLTKNRDKIYCEWYNAPLIDSAGQVIGVASLVEDITKRKLAEEALQKALNQLEIRVEERTQELKQAIAQLETEIELRAAVEASLIEREEQYRSVVDNVKEVIFQIDAEGLWTFLNPAWREITGFAIADSIATPFLDYIHPEDRQSHLQLFQPLIEGKKEYCRHQIRYLTADGDYRWMEVLAQLTYDTDGTIIGTFGTLNDITERHKSEAALKASEDRYRAIIEDQTELICRFLPDGTLTFVNEAYARQFGKQPEELINSSFLEMIPDQEAQEVKNYLASLNQENPVGRVEHRVVMSAGEIRFTQWNDRAIFDDSGSLIEFQSVGTDITERKQAEMALASRERYLAALVEVQRRLLAFEEEGDTPYHEILSLLGTVSGASRVYVFEYHPSRPLKNECQSPDLRINQESILNLETETLSMIKGMAESEISLQDTSKNLFMSQRASWCAPDIYREIDNQTQQNLSDYDFLPRWAQLLSQGEIIAGPVAEFPESERLVLEAQGILSILILPLTVNGNFFGCIGFDNRGMSKTWHASEVDLLTSAAAAVSLWYESFFAQKALRQSEATNRALLEAIPDALLRIGQDGTYLDFIPAKNFQPLIGASEIKGKTISQVLPPEFAVKILNDVNAALKTGKVQVSEESLKLSEIERNYESRTVFYNEDEALVIVREVTERKQAEAALRQSEERLASLVAHIPGVVYRCAYDADSTIEFISDVIEEISGYPASDFLHNQVRTFSSLVAPQDVARVELVMSECLAQKQPYVLEYRIIRVDGTARWVYEKGQGVFAADGSLLWLDGVIFDITDYKKTQEELHSSEEQFRQLTENINEVFFLSSPDLSQMFYISPAYEQIWGRSRKSLYEQPISWLESVHPCDRDRVAAFLSEHLQQNGELDHQYRIMRPDGSVRWVRSRAFFVLNEWVKPQRIAGIVEDITKRKQAEAEILNALAKEKELSDLKSRFISITSHEFRTPLTTILSTTELLEYYEWTKEEEVEQLHLIQDAVKQMLQMLEDLLFMGTAEAGQLRFNPEPLEINEFCQDLVAQIQRGIGWKTNPTGIQHTLTFRCSERTILACMDKKLLRQLLSNLLLNAIKYSPSGGKIQFELFCQDEYALFQIQDWGIGIPQEDQARLFEFFHRAKNVGAIAGTGLGLAIVKTCVDLHRGQITVNSDVDVGTKFTVTLPLKNQYYTSERERTEALTQKKPDP